MEGTLVGCAIAEKTDHHLIRASHLDGKASTASNRHAGGDDPICSQDSKVDVGDVHGTAFSVAVPGVMAKKLRYHPGNITSFGYLVFYFSSSSKRAGLRSWRISSILVRILVSYSGRVPGSM